MAVSFKEKHGIPILNSTAAALLVALILTLFRSWPPAPNTRPDGVYAETRANYYDYGVSDYYDTWTPSENTTR